VITKESGAANSAALSAFVDLVKSCKRAQVDYATTLFLAQRFCAAHEVKRIIEEPKK
jgi:hypothetical protein